MALPASRPAEDLPSQSTLDHPWWWAGLIALGLGEVFLFLLSSNPGGLASLLADWSGFDGIRVLGGVALGTLAVALLVGRAPSARAVASLPGWASRWRRPLWFLSLQVPLFLALLGLTWLVESRGPLYAEHFLRCAVGWLVLAVANLAVWSFVLFPERFWVLILKHGTEPLGAVALAWMTLTLWVLAYPLWPYLNQATTWGVSHLLRLIFPRVIYLPEEGQVGLPSYSLLITCPCGGAHGIGLILIFLTVYLWLFRHTLRFPAALALVPVGVVLMWLLNLGRITALVALGSWKFPWVDVDGFHSLAGWLGFLGVSLGLVLVGQHSRFLSAAEDFTPPAPSSRAAAYVAPLLAIVAVLMLGRIFSTGLDWLYPARVLAAGVALWLGWRYYSDWHWTWSWPALALGVGVFLLWLGLEPLAPGAADLSLGEELAGLPRSAAACWLVFRVVGSVVTVPLAEELAFRGYLFRRLIDADFQQVPPGRFTWFAGLASSILFGMVHGRWLAGTLAGLAYVWAYSRRGELADAVLAHAVTNALIAAYVLATGSWGLWAS